MRPAPRAIAALLLLVLGLQLGDQAARCLEEGPTPGTRSAVLAGAPEHHHCAAPDSPTGPSCPPQQTDCTMMSHCAVVMIVPTPAHHVVSVASPATPISGPPAEPDSFRSAPTPPPPRA